jgi:hypothetical protein
VFLTAFGIQRVVFPDGSREYERYFNGFLEPSLINWFDSRGVLGDLEILRLESIDSLGEAVLALAVIPWLIFLAIVELLKSLISSGQPKEPIRPESSHSPPIRPPGGKTDRFAPLC